LAKRIALAGACVAIGLCSFAVWHQVSASPAPPPETRTPGVPVVAQKVQQSDVPIVMSGIGTVAPYNVVDVTARVTGTIEKIGFVEGQTVHPGSLIAQIDPRPYQAALQQAEADLARDQSHLTNAEANLGRYVPLEKEGYATQQQVSDQSSTVTQLEAAILSDKAAIFNAQTQLSYTTITSPIDGVTGIRRVDIGNIIQPSTATPIVTITQIQPIAVMFTLPQSDIPAVQAAMAKGTLAAVAYDETDQAKLGEGKLLLVNNTISESSGTVQLKAIFPNANRALWPGEFVNVQLTVATQPDAITVPVSALQQGPSGTVVYVVQRDDTARPCPVKVAETLNGRALISQGLQAGETVVTAGQYRLGTDTKVALVPANDPLVDNNSEASSGML
jgi:membrane fusion protein, multidrug efflux system